MVIWLSLLEKTPARGYWDHRLLDSIFEDEESITTNSIDEVDEAIVIVPGAHHAPEIDRLNAELAKVKKCTLIITSDEESLLDLDKIDHPDIRVFAQSFTPKFKREITWIPLGAANTFKEELTEPTKNFVFSGQVTNPQREGYVKELRKRDDGEVLETDGFAKGLAPKEYYKLLTTAKVAPSPGGVVSPESFRTYEAIHAGAVPIPVGKHYHENMFGEVPFPVVDDFDGLNLVIDAAVSQFPVLNNKTQMWWLQYRRWLKNQLAPQKEDITIIMPVSPVKSHPDISIIDETIRTIRHHLPTSEIIVTFDGVREEQEDRRADYEEFKRRFLWECYNNPAYENILPLNFDEHSHQVKMARSALKYVNTDIVMYMEQDTPLVENKKITFSKCLKRIRTGYFNMIRFHFEDVVPEPHEHMMVGEVDEGFLRTSQWSQRPHLISKEYFEKILNNHFSGNAICFIEDKMHGIVSEDYIIHGYPGWEKHKLAIYHPRGGIKRSYHTDGRAGESKWDNKQIW